ncbi:Zn-ribbon domain-containing OB-fold protein [Sphingomonas sp. So64.6b]|uniref:Zn-ribbon domain-containing OB-fold protein n=1 Tax=Sphingomonas sp. So64.6b TaxID=2997354 RepID=UPI0015FFA616|nr:Zn-ribbon domain-containing OB-fold protein [Sphingomonas sp. So64.6b]QNA86635.1 Zn-ribbon domain-containing OB-fold protein [Sphingomonas sp. So64.6b]
MSDTADAIAAHLAAHVGRSYGPYRAWDAVNAPMIRQWREAISAENDDAAAAADIAPRSMINVWMMRGLADKRPADSVSDDPYELVGLLREQGYIGVVATRCTQQYGRNLRAGERVESQVIVESVSPKKATALGDGYFITLHHAYSVDGEPVGSMAFTTLHYAPRVQAKKPSPPQPGISDDTRFFWEGLKANRLLAQRCDDCGTLRHPPGPVCTKCHSFGWSAVELSGRGTLYSWTVVHHAAHPAFDYPHAIGLVDLDEGLRIVAPLEHVALDRLADGMALQAAFHNVDDEDRLPAFRPVAEAA